MVNDIKAVIFDLDDTLFDHRHSLQAGLLALQKACPDSLQAWPLAHLTDTYVDLVESLHVQVLQGLLTPDQARIQRICAFFSTYGRVLSSDEAQIYAALYRETYQAARQPVPGAIALLQYLHATVKIGIITNNTSLEQREKLDACGFTPWVDVVVISEEVGFIKPDPAIFAIALQQLGCGADQAVMVGDSWKSDIVGAHQAGIKSIWLNRFGEICPDSSIGATTIESLTPTQTVATLICA